MTPEEMAKKTAQAILDIGNPNLPRTMYQPPRVSEHDVIAQHQQAQAKRLK